MSAAWRWIRRNALTVYAALAIAYMLVPIAVIAVFSFNDPEGKFNFTWRAFTLDNWQNAFAVTDLNDALLTSLGLAALSTAISLVLGTLIALALVRHEFFGRRTANFLIVIPMATPEVVIGAALLSMFLIYGIELGFPTLLIAHVMFSISFVVVVVRSRLIGFDRSLEEAARDLGATPLTTFRTITLPLLMPGLIGAVASRLRSLDRRFRDLELQLRHHGHVPAVGLWRGPARDPRPGLRDRDDAVCGDRRRDDLHDLAAAPSREAGGGSARAR